MWQSIKSSAVTGVECRLSPQECDRLIEAKGYEDERNSHLRVELEQVKKVANDQAQLAEQRHREIQNLFELLRERDVLAATLRTAINENCFGPCHEPDGSVGVDGYPWAFKVLSETEDSALCLAVHDAEVAAKAVLDYNLQLRKDIDDKLPLHCMGVHGEDYVAQLRANAGA